MRTCRRNCIDVLENYETTLTRPIIRPIISAIRIATGLGEITVCTLKYAYNSYSHQPPATSQEAQAELMNYLAIPPLVDIVLGYAYIPKTTHYQPTESIIKSLLHLTTGLDLITIAITSIREYKKDENNRRHMQSIVSRKFSPSHLGLLDRYN